MRPVLVILPGWGGNKDTWKEFASLASKDFNVQIIDLPCFGDEPCPETAWGVEEYANFVSQRISNFSTPQRDPVFAAGQFPISNKPILLGHSFGGQIAAVFATKYPEMIDRLILSGPAVFRPKKYSKRAIMYSISKIGKLFFRLPLIGKYENGLKNIFYNLIKAKDYHESSGIKREIFKKIIRQDRGEEASKISIPTLIVWGTMDGYLPVSDAYRLNKLIKNSQLEIIKGGRHGLHLQMPEKLYRIIYDFCH